VLVDAYQDSRRTSAKPRVLNRCWHTAADHAIYLQKLLMARVSPRSTRAPTRSSASSWQGSCWS